MLPIDDTDALQKYIYNISEKKKHMLVQALKHFKIIWISNLSTLSVPDESDSESASCTLN